MRGKGRRLFNRYYGYSPDEPHSLLDISNITGYDLFHIERMYNYLIKYKYRTRTYKYAWAYGTIYSACVPHHYHYQEYGHFLRRKKPVKWGKYKR